MELADLVAAALAEDLGDRGDVTSLVTIPEGTRARGRVVARSGGVFAGRAFGRRKLAPAVSPGKTWEGAAGGLLAVVALAAAAAPWLGRPRGGLVVASVVVAAFSIVGDLTESLFKRQAGLKDSGHMIPGHGGLLDRIDSLTAAAPLLLLADGWLR